MTLHVDDIETSIGHLLVAARQHLVVEDLIVGSGGVLKLIERLLGVGDLEEDFTAALARFGVHPGLLGALGRLAIDGQRRGQRFLMADRIGLRIGRRARLGFAEPKQYLVGELFFAIYQRRQRLDGLGEVLELYLAEADAQLGLAAQGRLRI